MEIYLNINENLTALAGYDYGKEIAFYQIIDKINPLEVNKIYFPKHIEIIAEGGFLSGIYAKIYDKFPNISMDKIQLIKLYNDEDISRKD